MPASEVVYLQLLDLIVRVEAETRLADAVRRTWRSTTLPDLSAVPVDRGRPVDPLCVSLVARPRSGEVTVTVADPGGDDVERVPADAALLALAVALNRRALDGWPNLAVHAGVVAHAGRALAVPGASGIGKTTLVAACLRAGFDYVSDESLVTTDETVATARVKAYPRPLGLSPWSAAAVGLALPGAPDSQSDPPSEVLADAAEFGSRSLGTDERPRLEHVVVPHRSPETAPPRLVRRHRVDTVPLLLAMAFNHYRAPEAALRTANALAQASSCWDLHYGDPLAGGELLWALVNEPADPPSG